MCGQPAPQRVREDVVREQPLALEFDDREELAVRGLEVGVPGDVDLDKRESELLAQRDELLAGSFAEVTALRVEERDGRAHLIVKRTERIVSGPPSVGYAITRSV